MKPIPWKWKVFALWMLLFFLISCLYATYLFVGVLNFDDSAAKNIKRPFYIPALLKELLLILFLLSAFHLFFRNFFSQKKWKPTIIWQYFFYAIAVLLFLFELQACWILFKPFVYREIAAYIPSKPAKEIILIRILHLALIVYLLVYTHFLLRIRIKAYHKMEDETINQIGQ